jgi:translation elongation factor P/translation initiation factor 5A
LDEDDETLIELANELKEVKETIEQLEMKKKKLDYVDKEEEFKLFYDVLSDFEEKYYALPLEKRQRLFSFLVSYLEMAYVAPHWVRIVIHWLPALFTRTDIMLLWRNNPRQSGPFTEREIAILQEHYASSPMLEILKMLPNRTWNSIRTFARTELKMFRKAYRFDNVPGKACWLDMAPDGENFLFEDREETFEAIRLGIRNTSKQKDMLYPFWIVPADLRELRPTEDNVHTVLSKLPS